MFHSIMIFDEAFWFINIVKGQKHDILNHVQSIYQLYNSLMDKTISLQFTALDAVFKVKHC